MLARARFVRVGHERTARLRETGLRLEGALRVTQELKDAQRSFYANVSHDLRTPLVSLRGYLEILGAKGDTLAPETRRQYLDIALRQSDYLIST